MRGASDRITGIRLRYRHHVTRVVRCEGALRVCRSARQTFFMPPPAPGTMPGRTTLDIAGPAGERSPVHLSRIHAAG